MHIKDTKKNENYLRLQQSFLLKSNLDESCSTRSIVMMLIANKWTLLILMALMQGTKRTNELQKQINGISPKMLNETLKKLIDYDMVKRKVYPRSSTACGIRAYRFWNKYSRPLNCATRLVGRERSQIDYTLSQVKKEQIIKTALRS